MRTNNTYSDGYLDTSYNLAGQGAWLPSGKLSEKDLLDICGIILTYELQHFYNKTHDSIFTSNKQ
jgi:hypothetical protein